MPDDLRPFLLCRATGGRAECATWSLAHGGHTALALFGSPTAAERYRQAARLANDWRCVQPDRKPLAILLRVAHSAGIRLAVLDPCDGHAQRIFELDSMLPEIERTIADAEQTSDSNPPRPKPAGDQ